MAEQIQEVEETIVQDGVPAQTTRRVRTDTTPGGVPTAVVARPSTYERVVWYIAGVIISLLALRFVLSLLGANRGNPFAGLIYALTSIFVAPFFGLFGYDMEYGVARFEIETLVAMGVYALLAYGIAKLIRIVRRTA